MRGPSAAFVAAAATCPPPPSPATATRSRAVNSIPPSAAPAASATHPRPTGMNRSALLTALPPRHHVLDCSPVPPPRLPARSAETRLRRRERIGARRVAGGEESANGDADGAPLAANRARGPVLC